MKRKFCPASDKDYSNYNITSTFDIIRIQQMKCKPHGWVKNLCQTSIMQVNDRCEEGYDRTNGKWWISEENPAILEWHITSMQSYLGNETLIATLNGRSINSWHSCIRSISGDDTLGSKLYFILGEGEDRKSAWVLFYLLYLHQFAQ